MPSRRDFLRTSAAGVGLLAVAPMLMGGDGDPVIVPPADTAHTAEKLGLGETKHYVFWTGKMRDFRLYRRWAHYYTAEEFSFTFDSDGQGTWQVISREPTPWYDWRMGTTFLRQSADELARGTRVRVMGLKNFIDRLPKTFQNVKLDVERILSALIVEVWRADAKLDGGGRWAPWHINNWFHNWGTPADDALVASHYVDKPAPYYLAFTHQSTKNIACGGFTDKSAELIAKDKRLANTPGAGFRLVSDAKKSPPWALEADEDRRQLHRGLKDLQRQQTECSNRIKGLLASQGLDAPVDAGFRTTLAGLRDWSGQPVPAGLRERLLQEFTAWETLHRQVHIVLVSDRVVEAHDLVALRCCAKCQRVVKRSGQGHHDSGRPHPSHTFREVLVACCPFQAVGVRGIFGLCKRPKFTGGPRVVSPPRRASLHSASMAWQRLRALVACSRPWTDGQHASSS